MLNGIIEVDGQSICWFRNDQLHREDGPAVLKISGTREWYLNGKKHRDDGPAVEHVNGTRSWWLNDLLHRLDGPAYEGADGRREWWINGVEYTEEEHKQELLVRKWGLSVDSRA